MKVTRFFKDFAKNKTKPAGKYRSQKLPLIYSLVLLAFQALAISGSAAHPGNTTLAFPEKPPSGNYEMVDAFPGLEFENPVNAISAPGETNRLFVLEQQGRLWVIPDLTNPQKELFMDFRGKAIVPYAAESGLLGMAFHPGFTTNKFFFIYYTPDTTNSVNGYGYLNRLSRFNISPQNPNRGAMDSEIVFLEQFDRDTWHNAGHIEFGPEGYLYLSLGDEGFGDDYYINSQYIDHNLFSGIIRIDVDKRPGNLAPNPHSAISTNYLIPSDNPFVNTTHFNGIPVDPKRVRTEFYAVGMRNPWGFSIDPLTGDIYACDTGQNTWEEINFIRKGSNHGWRGYHASERIGHLWRPEFENMFHSPPIAFYRNGGDIGTAATAALFYRHNHYANLAGHVLFSDLGGGTIGKVKLFDTDFYTELTQKYEAVTEAEELVHNITPETLTNLANWEAERKWSILTPLTYSAQNTTGFEIQPDASLLATGPAPNADVYEIISETTETNIQTIRLDVYADPRLPNGGPGRDARKDQMFPNFVLSEITVEIAPANDPDAFVKVDLVDAKASFSQQGFSITEAIDGNIRTGWAVYPQLKRSHVALFRFAESVGFPQGTRFRVRLVQDEDTFPNILGLVIGRFRLAISTNAPDVDVSLPAYMVTLLDRLPTNRTDDDLNTIQRYYTEIAPEKQPARNALRAAQNEVTQLLSDNPREIEVITKNIGISGFWTHPVSGEIYGVNYIEGKIKKLVETSPGTGTPLPPTLADTGIFSDLLSLTPHEGIIPYEINTPFWSDNADKYRWFSVPDTNQLLGFNTTGHWQFPTGTVWIKHFELELERGNPDSRRRIETRAVVRNNDGVYGVTYRWDDTQTNAYLVPEAGTNEIFQIVENGQIRNQNWRYPSRSECLQCHSAAAGFALGFSTAQLNRSLSGTNQLDWLKAHGYFSEPETVPAPAVAPRMAYKDDENESLQNRVKSYLASNCAQCHRPGGAGRGAWDARYELPLEQMNLINVTPLEGIYPPESRLVKPGSLDHSVLYHRLAHFGDDHMPPLATSVINDDALKLLERWILTELPHYAAGSNLPPTVSLSAPTNRMVRLPASVSFQVSAADSDGTITNIQVRANATSVGNTSTRPFTVDWAAANGGVFAITATAQDNAGASVTTEPFNLLVIGQGNDSPVKVDGLTLNVSGSLSLGLDPLLASFAPVLEVSSDLELWTPIATNLQQQTPWVINDPNPTGDNQRFYRIIIPNQ